MWLKVFSSCGMQAYLPSGMWDLISLTRDQIGRWTLYHWITRESPRLLPLGCVPTPRLRTGSREAPWALSTQGATAGALPGTVRWRGAPSPQRGQLWKLSPQADSHLPGLLDKALWLVSQQLFDLRQVRGMLPEASRNKKGAEGQGRKLTPTTGVEKQTS